MRGVSFGEYNSVTDWDAILSERNLTPPTPKTSYVSIEGRDGDLDLSETLTGEIKYKDRTARYSFLITEGSYSDREVIIQEMINVLQGKKLNIVDPDYPDHYLVGRCKITEREHNKSYGMISVEATCEPWLYSDTETTRSITVSSSTTISLANNGRKTVCPEITVTGTITIVYDNKSVALTTGTYKLADFTIPSGYKSITLNGSGTIVFTYREGVL